MGNKRWYEGRWVERPALAAIGYIPPHWLDEDKIGCVFPPDEKPYSITIGRMELNELVDFLHKNGYIKPQFAENRTEDIKVIHRLIDVVEKGVPRKEGES